MTIKYVINGAQTAIPGVYSFFYVQNSLPVAANAGRSVFIFGEAESGLPGDQLDLKLNYFTDFDSVKDYYKSGPIVDAARELFNAPPSPVFSLPLDRLYVYKTNDSTRAERAIVSPSDYGDIVAAAFGEDGNLIKTQLIDAQNEDKPSASFSYLPSPLARDFSVMVSGVKQSVSLTAGQVASDLQPLLDGLTDLSATGGDARIDVTGAMDVLLSSVGDVLTISKDSGAGLFDSSIVAGDIAYIAPASVLAGAADENAGSYEVVSVADSSLSLRQIKKAAVAGEANAVAFDLDPVSILAAGVISINAPLVLEHTGITKDGSGATLEILEDGADKAIAGLFYNSDFSNLLQSSTSSVAEISASIPSVGKLRVALNRGNWSYVPKAGDIVRISRSSLLAGASSLNVGSFIVESSSSQHIVMSHLFSGMTTEVIASVALAGANDTLEYSLGFASSEISAKRIDSNFERKVSVQASRESDGESIVDNSIGGSAVLEIGYYNAAATSATVSISNLRVMTISPVGAGLTDIVVNTRKYSSLQELVTFLNTRSGVSAKVAYPLAKSMSTDVLDMVDSLACLSGHSDSAYNARIKRDYYDFKKFFEDNFGLVAFREGTMSLKSGLPDAESNPIFLDGATLGSTSNASIQNALDAALKINVRQVVPLFSRDAFKDIADGLTDEASSYSIDSVNAAARAHVATASGVLFRKERQANLSFYGSFEDSKTKAAEIASDRCQMFFELHNATDGEGTLRRFLPWMGAVAAASARVRAPLGTSLLRKPLLLSSAEHYGDVSLFTDSIIPDFDFEDRGQLESAIESGLTVLGQAAGFGVYMMSPDSNSRSRENDPQAWVYERAQVVFIIDEVSQTLRSILESYIGSRQSDVSPSVIKQALIDALGAFLLGTGNGALLAAQVTDVKRVGVQYNAKIVIQPTEALEAISLEIFASRDLV